MDEWVASKKCARCEYDASGIVFAGMDSCRDVPQYKVMKYLVFGIISSSLLSELQVMIPTVDHNGVCICLVYPTFSTSFNDKNDKQFQGVVLSEFGVLRFLFFLGWVCGVRA
jgi:hypothetical protein